MTAIITLTTDFGLKDEYVGVMKGVIISRCPGVALVDLSHNIDKQDMGQAAYLIQSAVPYFPSGTVHVIVVDPWVGSNRRILLVRADDQFFLAPDNGILTLVVGQTRDLECFEVDCPGIYLNPVSNTFHGRDIFAPVAAAVAKGTAPEELGRRLNPGSIACLDLPMVEMDHDKRLICGEVVRIDHFGNLVSNIHQHIVGKLAGQGGAGPMSVEICGQKIPRIEDSYSAVPLKSLLAIFGSRGYLEVALNQGNAAEQLNASCGTKIMVRPDGPNLSLYKK